MQNPTTEKLKNCDITKEVVDTKIKMYRSGGDLVVNIIDQCQLVIESRKGKVLYVYTYDTEYTSTKFRYNLTYLEEKFPLLRYVENLNDFGILKQIASVVRGDVWKYGIQKEWWEDEPK